jgi:single-strand DNA-binding protein
MAFTMNHVFLMGGGLVRDAEIAVTKNGTPVAKFSVAVARGVKGQDGTWHDEVDYFDVVYYGNSVNGIGQYLVKGAKVAIHGELRQEKWEDKQTGKHRSTVRVIASNILLMGARQTEAKPDYDNQQPESNGDYQRVYYPPPPSFQPPGGYSNPGSGEYAGPVSGPDDVNKVPF